MNITMTLTADTAAELFATIKDAAAQITADTAPAAPVIPASNPTPAPVATPVNTLPEGAPYVPVTPGPAPIQTPPVGKMAAAAPVMHSPSPAVPLAATPTYNLDQIAKAGAELAQAGKINELLSLLQQFGIQAVTQIKPEQIGPFATALRGLGAQL
ncbi:MAG: hypothetical protein VB064_12990 [Oscillospiraceae bacterium]|nr:hypothetical protein [Oscillospiraceae bacterium]